MRIAKLAVLVLAVSGWAVAAVALGQGTKPAAAGEDAAADVDVDTPAPAAGKAAPAKGGGTAGGGGGRTAPTPGRSLQTYLPFLLLGGVFLLWFWMGRGRKKQERKRREMLESLRKGDKVTSIGGIVGTIVDVRDDEITLKVDESANVRLKFARWAVRGLGDAGKAERPEDAEKKQV